MEEFHANIFVHGLLPMALGFIGLMCLRFKAVVPGMTCWAMALGIYLLVANKYGIDALGQIASISIIWVTIFCIGWAFFGAVGIGVRATTRDLPSGDWNGGGGRRYTVSGDPNEPPPASPETYERTNEDDIPQIAPGPNDAPRAEKPSPPRIHRGPQKSRFAMNVPRRSKRP